jgi:hypothetical protein
MKTDKVKEIAMKTSKISKRVLSAAILTCLIAVGSGSAFAQELLRYNNVKDPLEFANTCPNGNLCSDWGETVSTDEPDSLEPVVVIWSARYFVNTADVYYAGLDVNGKGCQTGVYGPVNLDDISTIPAGHFLTVTFQWIVQPSDGLLESGKSNTFELCGGGEGSVSGDKITIVQNTLSVAKY